MKKLLFSLGVLSTLLFSCKTETATPTTEEKATVRFKVQHHFNGKALNLTDEFITENGDTVVFSQFKYFLSNAILRGDSISPLVLDNSYYLVDITDSPIQNIEIGGLNPATYSSFEISLGVDSTANHSTISNSGDLQPGGGDGMIWSWSTGYKFLRSEGSYKKATDTGNFVLHLGKDANYKTFTFGTKDSGSGHTDDMNNGHTTDEQHHAAKIASGDHGHTEGTETIELKAGKVTEIHLMVNIAELFVSPTTIDLHTYSAGHSGGGDILTNAVHSTDDTKNGWFELHHITTK